MMNCRRREVTFRTVKASITLEFSPTMQLPKYRSEIESAELGNGDCLGSGCANGVSAGILGATTASLGTCQGATGATANVSGFSTRALIVTTWLLLESRTFAISSVSSNGPASDGLKTNCTECDPRAGTAPLRPAGSLRNPLEIEPLFVTLYSAGTLERFVIVTLRIVASDCVP